jgi:outer membrane protein assembly factor BamB
MTDMSLRTLFVAPLLLLLLISLSPAAKEGAKRDANWQQFRGPNASGVAEGFPTPTIWGVEENLNLKWKTPIPGLSHASPIIWGDKVFVTTAISGKEKPELVVGLYGNVTPVEDDTVHEWRVYCLDKKTGKVLWQQTAQRGVPKIKRHTKATHANSTMATDGKHLIAFFGSEGLYCYDLNGKLLWKKDFGVLDSGWFVSPQAQWGFASSPIIYENMVIVQCDVLTKPFIAALDIEGGREIWRTSRDEVPTWSTPTVHTEGDRAQIIVNGYKHIGGYDLKTGKELWKLKGGGDIPVPTPVVGHGLVFIANAHGFMAPIYAVRLNATGDISLQRDQTSNEGIAWSEARNGAYMQTPLVYGDYVYSCRDNGVVSCYEAKTGKRVYQERIGTGRTGFTASPVAANEKIYFTSEEGDVYVIKAGPAFQLIARNLMNEICMATPAISEGVLFFRTQGHVVAVGEKDKR